MKAALVLLVAAIALHAASAHMCLLQPMQRGGATGATTMPDDKMCAHTTAPCGGMAPGPSVLTIGCGSEITIGWVKNVNHWFAQSPGNFTVQAWMNGQMLGGPFVTVMDTNTTDLSRYTVTQPVPPKLMAGAYTLEVVYTTGRGFNFYQCADITITC